MASSPILTVFEESQVSPPPATIGHRSLPLTFFDIFWLTQPPIHYLFFYEIPSITQSHFLQTIIPDLKRYLSLTLHHFFPFSGNLTIYPNSTKKPEIRYVEGDSVTVTFAETNLDFNELTANHPRDCEMFYHLTPLLGQPDKTSDYTKIPLFSVQVTLFPNNGISIGMTNHHCLGDANTRFNFMKAWTSIARSGSHETLLAKGTLPVYDRSLLKNDKLEESYFKFVKVENLTKEEYELPKLCGPTDKLRATFVLPCTVINRLKNLVSTEVPTLVYISSFTVTCAYIWSCRAGMGKDERQLFTFPMDCRARMNPPIPAAYFGNCIRGCFVMENTRELTGKKGFVTAAKLIGESLYKILTDKDRIIKDAESIGDLFADGNIPKTIIGVAGTPKLKFYEMDFGWGKPKKVEAVSIDYGGSISMNACRETNEDLEIGVCLSPTEMKSFVRLFENGLEAYI